VQLFTPSDRVASRVNIHFLDDLVREKRIDVIINQAATKIDVLRLLCSLHRSCQLFSVHHNCVACLQRVHRSVIESSMDRAGLPRAIRFEMLLRLLRWRSRLKTGRAFELAAEESNRLVLLSDRFIDELSAFSKSLDLSKVVSIPNPAPFSTDFDAMSEKEDILLFVGRLSNAQKRVDRALTIWSQVFELFPNWRLDIVGDGPDRTLLEQRAKDMYLDRVTFHGQQDPVSFYRKARMLLLTSDFEGFPMVLIEAQAFGCVPIAFECFSSIGDIIEHGQTGILVSNGEVRKFSAELHVLMADQARTRMLARNGLSANTKRSPAQIVDKWLRLIEETR
jgi:glycosyltransferase involved in cell wall biosynthesis